MYQKGMSPRAKRCVYVDGQPGAQYDALAVSALQFSPDSRHSVYVVDGPEQGSQNVSFVVIDRAEGKRYEAVYADTLDVSDAGVRYAARAGRRFLRVAQPLQ
jgi:hypothetical protein